MDDAHMGDLSLQWQYLNINNKFYHTAGFYYHRDIEMTHV